MTLHTTWNLTRRARLAPQVVIAVLANQARRVRFHVVCNVISFDHSDPSGRCFKQPFSIPKPGNSKCWDILPGAAVDFLRANVRAPANRDGRLVAGVRRDVATHGWQQPGPTVARGCARKRAGFSRLLEPFSTLIPKTDDSLWPNGSRNHDIWLWLM